MEKSPPSRVSGTAGRPISGWSRWPLRRPGLGKRNLRVRARAPNATRSRTKSPCALRSRRGRKRRTVRCGRCAIHGIARPKTSIPPGSKNFLTRHSKPRSRGKRCMRCCAIARAMSCSTISVCGKTRWDSLFVPTAPTCHTSCAPTSRSRWACRSATRNARAVGPARDRSATPGGTFRISSRRLRRNRQRSKGLRLPPLWRCFARRSSSRRHPHRADLRRSSGWGWRRGSASICARPSPTAFIPEAGERR